MNINRKRLSLLVMVFSLAAGGAAAVSSQGDAMTCHSMQENTVPIATAKLYVEYNATDGDLGVHGAFDDQGWSELCIFDPGGMLLLVVSPQSQMRDLTLGGIFFESREPPISEFSFDDLMAKFPEGQYAVRGTDFDGTGLTGAATFSHDVPAAPIITAPVLAEDEETASEVVVSATDLVIEWEDVTETVTGNALTVTGYEVIVTNEDYDDSNGFSQPIFDVHVPADRNRLSVPVEFLEPDTLYELEVLVLEQSGNQTISVGFFKTA